MVVQSFGIEVEIVFMDNAGKEAIDLSYRSKTKNGFAIEELLKKEIDKISKKYKINKNVISIMLKFTG